jgi:trans-aconitate methyltransferase
MSDPKHWSDVYGSKPADAMSWFQSDAQPSLDLILAHRGQAARGVIDIGAGASRLVDGLIDAGLCDVTLLDLADTAFDEVRRRLGPDAGTPRYVVGDVTAWRPERRFGVWHDRAAFHFLTGTDQQDAYIAALYAATGPGAVAVIATFAPDGPERCSGLPVRRWSSDDLAARLAPGFRRLHAVEDHHTTPGGAAQAFQYTVLERV